MAVNEMLDMFRKLEFRNSLFAVKQGLGLLQTDMKSNAIRL